MKEKQRDRVIEALSTCRSFEDVKRIGILFHGTCEKIEGDPKGGGYDGVFWTAESPDVAQAYIPRSGVTTWLHAPSDYCRDDHIKPMKHGGWIMDWAMQRAGVTLDDLDVTWNGMSAYSWTIPKNWPTEGDLEDHLLSMGYEADAMGVYKVSLSYEKSLDGTGSRECLKPADWKLPGHLLIILANEIDIRDPEWSEDALGYETHNRVADFDRFSQSGIDAIRMSDCLQSDYQGNVPHKSIGLFPQGLEKISWMSIPATRHDGASLETWKGAETPEFSEFMKGLNPDYQTSDEIERANRRYAVMCDSSRAFDQKILARAAPERSKEKGFWVYDDPGKVWLMDRKTAEEVAGRLVFNNPRIVREEKALAIIARQREAKMTRDHTIENQT